jgi:hypothetical protein
MKVKSLFASLMVAVSVSFAVPANASNYKCPEQMVLARKVGWRKADLPTLDRIMFRESRCFARAWNKRDPWTGSYGLMQINGSWRGDLTRKGYIKSTMTELFNQRLNLTVALYIKNRYGWLPWAGEGSSA